jgi:hypothetical protein
MELANARDTTRKVTLVQRHWTKVTVEFTKFLRGLKDE